MNSLILCVPMGVSIREMADRLATAGLSVEIAGERLLVSGHDSVAWVEADSTGELKKEYEPGEVGFMEEVVGAWVGYIVDYRHIGVARAIVSIVCAAWECVVDDEQGFFGPDSEYFADRR